MSAAAHHFPKLILAVLLSAAFLFSLSRPPAAFSGEKIIEIKTGVTASETAHLLEKAGIIRSPGLFENVVIFFGKDGEVRAGFYRFAEPETLLRVVVRIMRGDYGFTPAKVTVPEGLMNREIALLLEKQAFTSFDKETFLALAKEDEGYLFPDTYFFYQFFSETDVIRAMRENFERRVGVVSRETVILASLLEKEAREEGDRRLVAGILKKRLASGMPLQVDAVFLYLLGKGSKELTAKDLNLNSPYNTYRYKGLPPGPIANPGLAALRAVEEAEDSPYWYYLSDKEGTIHYARTFEEHKANKAKYFK